MVLAERDASDRGPVCQPRERHARERQRRERQKVTYKIVERPPHLCGFQPSSAENAPKLGPCRRSGSCTPLIL
jgi:hypothetical protein